MDNFQKIELSRTNCFLLRAADGYLLIDCGYAGNEQRFLLKLKRLGLEPSSVRYLLLTHHHSDHCGLLPYLLSLNPQIRIIMNEKCAAYLEAGRNVHPAAERYASGTLSAAMQLYGLAGGKAADTFSPYFRRAGDIILSEQHDVLPDFIGIPGRFLHTPGHTKGSISLIVGEDAFVGDAARNILKLAGAPYEPILYYDKEACHDSWRRILSTGAKRIHPAHGKSFPAVYLERYV
ncbi:MAG: MBL fold metallo-hydrolase [Oscillospiraceae bacterium]|nr:MBL fold metallo-hydrolase [Oscillospiraceae bacterium]